MRSVAEIMTAQPCNLGPDDNLAQARALMAQHHDNTVQTVDERASLRGTALFLRQNKLGCVPVVQDGKLIGIITDSVFVGIAVHLMEQTEQVGSQAEPDFEDSSAEVLDAL